ncbi:MAG: protein kinase [Anaerolineae bacterium]|nr:protein kinase [Anaerolineae bacterium]
MSHEITNLTGQSIKGYELHELIGSGGFGAVYRAYQASVDREVAVKIILPQHANDPDFIRRFDSEAQLIARLENLHIVPLYDYWREPGMAFLVMRLLRGGSLQESLEKRGSWAISDASRLIGQVASALSIAHRSNIIHRDIKPANILLDEENNAYLADFGIAKKLTTDSQMPSEEDRYGSPAFISPEQVVGSPVSPQSDIYSLGMVLYVMLTGNTPFYDTSTSTVIRKQLSESLPPLQALRADIPYAVNIVIWRATSKRPEARYANVLDFAAELHQIVNETDDPASQLAHTASPSHHPGYVPIVGARTVIIEPFPIPTNPYKGLRAFQEADAGDFFGRSALINRIMNRLQNPEANTRFLAVVGPSGSGKSSVVRAGVIPTLKRGGVGSSQNWFYIQMTPGANPLQELADSLLSVAVNKPDSFTDLFTDETALARLVAAILPDVQSELLLLIDQFEEVFTLVADEKVRLHFLLLLVNAAKEPQSRLRIIITLRADFYDRPLLYPGLSDLIRDHTEIVLPLSPSEIREAITEPVERLGIQFEPGLVTDIVSEVAQQPGALPLLQYALTELFEKRSNFLLTNQAYKSTGGVLGALARRADELYENLDSASQAAAQQMFLRLITLGDGVDDSRRRTLRSELNAIAADKKIAQYVIDEFGRYRLLTFDYEPGTRAPTVEIAHEALIRVWGRLRDWLESNREEVRLQRRLSAAAAEWITSNRDPSFLVTGSRLVQYEVLGVSPAIKLTPEESTFLWASVRARQQAANRLRNIMIGLAGIALFAIALALFAFDRQRVAEAEQQRADQQASLARSREIAVTALTGTDRLDLRLLLSLESQNIADTFEARNSLLTNLQSAPDMLRYLSGHTDAVRTVSYSPDGRLLASGGRDNIIIIRDAQTGQPIGAPLSGHTNWINSLAFSADSQVLYSASADGTLRRWDTQTGQPISAPLSVNQAVWSVTASPDGEFIAAGAADGSITIWNSNGEQIGQPIAAHTDIVYALAFSPDSRQLASASGDGSIQVWNPENAQPLTDPLLGHTGFVLNLLYTPDGSTLISTGVDAEVIFWDTQTGELLYSIPTGHTRRVKGLALSPDGQILATGSDDAALRLWDMSTGEMIGSPHSGHLDAIWSLSFAPDGATIASASSDRSVIIWNTTDLPALSIAALPQSDDALSVTFNPDGTQFAFAGGFLNEEDFNIHLWDSASLEETAFLEGHTNYITGLAYSPDNQHLVSASVDGTLRIWNLITRATDHTLQLDGFNPFIALAYSSDGHTIASGGADGTIILWDAASGQRISDSIPAHTDGIRALSFSTDGKRLASASQDNTVSIYDIESRTRITDPLTAHTDDVLALAFSPDDTLLATGSKDRSILLWDTTTWQLAAPPLLGHADWVTSLDFTSDQKLLASASQDNAIILWDVNQKQQLGRPLLGHTNYVNALAFSPDGKMLISAGEDQNIFVWRTSFGEWRATACSIASRNLTPQEWSRYFSDLPYHSTCNPEA